MAYDLISTEIELSIFFVCLNFYAALHFCLLYMLVHVTSLAIMSESSQSFVSIFVDPITMRSLAFVAGLTRGKERKGI